MAVRNVNVQTTCLLLSTRAPIRIGLAGRGNDRVYTHKVDAENLPHWTDHVVALAAGYYAGGWLVDRSPRLGRLYARRFTVQERLGEQIADGLVDLISAHGVAVHLEASHLCTQMRGVEEEGSRTVTTFWRGLYEEDADLRREFLDEARCRRQR